MNNKITDYLTDDFVRKDFIKFDSDFYASEIELDLGHYKIENRDGKMFAIIQCPKYPSSYEECCKILGVEPNKINIMNTYKGILIDAFCKLLICRDAYWAIADNWHPEYNSNVEHYSIVVRSEILCPTTFMSIQHLLTFPTPEMRNAFYENFKDIIHECKELI